MSLLLLAGAIVIGAPALKDGRKPVDQPDGEWTLQSIDYDGTPRLTSEDLSRAGYALRLEKNQLSFMNGKRRVTSEPVLFFDHAGRMEIDFSPDDPKYLKKGIWGVKDDVLTICLANPGIERPEDFTATEGSRREIWTFRRKPK
jgi:hypothetical protein